MNKVNKFVLSTLLIVLITCVSFSSCIQTTTDALKVVTSTSLLAFIVEQIGDDTLEVVNIIPPTQCPSHFDVKPGDIQKLSEADIFFMHGWQGEKFTTDLITSAENPSLTVVKVDMQGNWMTPSVQIKATDKLISELCQIDPDNCPIYEESAIKYQTTISRKGDELKDILSKVNTSKVNVLCAEQQAGFVKWAGLNIAGTFGRPDSLTPQVIKELVDKGRAEDVTLIIDNLQSGPDAGASIAEELGCNRIILSNFPGGFDDTETWEKAIEKNVALLLEAISQNSSP